MVGTALHRWMRIVNGVNSVKIAVCIKLSTYVQVISKLPNIRMAFLMTAKYMQSRVTLLSLPGCIFVACVEILWLLWMWMPS